MNCENCKFSEELKGERFGGLGSVYQCKYNPPIIIEKMFMKNWEDEECSSYTEAVLDATVHPVVFGSDRCGKWEEATK